MSCVCMCVYLCVYDVCVCIYHAQKKRKSQWLAEERGSFNYGSLDRTVKPCFRKSAVCKDKTQSYTHARQVLCPWATSLAVYMCVLTDWISSCCLGLFLNPGLKLPSCQVVDVRGWKEWAGGCPGHYQVLSLAGTTKTKWTSGKYSRSSHRERKSSKFIHLGGRNPKAGCPGYFVGLLGPPAFPIFPV